MVFGVSLIIVALNLKYINVDSLYNRLTNYQSSINIISACNYFSMKTSVVFVYAVRLIVYDYLCCVHLLTFSLLEGS